MFVNLLFYIAALVGSVVSKPTSKSQEVSIISSSDYVIEGVTKRLTLNCSHVQSANDDVMISLTLSKSEDYVSFKNIAVLTSYGPKHVHIHDDLGATVEGHLDQEGTSYVSYKWDFPDAASTGGYKCTVNVNQLSGQSITELASLGVMLKNVNIDDIQDKLREMSLTQENILKDLQDTNDLLTKTREEMESSREITISIQKYVHETFIASTTHGGRTYSVSRPMLVDAVKFNSLCMVEGGYLVEINDYKEFKFVNSFYSKVNNPRELDLMIGISDFGHQGDWKYINSGQPVTYTNWYTNQPWDGPGYDCAYLSFYYRKMFGNRCVDGDPVIFMCEIPGF